MKTRQYIYSAILTLASLFTAIDASAELPTSGVWSGQTVTTQTVNLTGNVSISGTIIIPSGVTLTINSNGAARTISPRGSVTDFNNHLFDVKSGGKLVIKGTSTNKITISGRAYFDVKAASDGYLKSTNALVSSPGEGETARSTTFSLIYMEGGTLQMDYVTIHNVNNTYNTPQAGSKYVAGVFGFATNVSNTVTINNCLFQKIKAWSAPVAFFGGGSSGSFTMTDCEIKNCVCACPNNSTGGDNGCGIIRAIGSSNVAITLKSTKIHHNFGSHSGSILQVNGCSTNSRLDIDGCEFNNNYSFGTAPFVCSGNIEFKSNLTKIHHNYNAGSTSSDGYGTVYLASYSGSAPPATAVTQKQVLNKYVEINNNYVKGSGGGVKITSAADPTLVSGSSYQVLLDGVNIHDNEALNNGGGLHYSNNYTGSAIKVSFAFKSGKITNNKAGNNGGGVWLNKINFDFSGGNITSNTADKYGGGIYVTDGTLNFIGGNIDGNTSGDDGGGVYVTAGTLNFSGGKINGNTSGDNGGGAYIINSTLDFTDGYITNNTAENYGGGVDVWESTFKYSRTPSGAGNISGNKAIASALNGGGGGIYAASGTGATTKSVVIITNGDILNNYSGHRGGGVYLGGGGTFTFTGGEISGNEAKYHGGGVWSNGTFTLNGGKVKNNSADIFGGGVAQCTMDMTFSKGELQGNEAPSGGGAYIYAGGKLTYKNGGIICHNEADNKGGGVYLEAGTNTSGRKSTLDFDLSGMSAEDKLGFYDNIADSGAGDDLYAEGGYTDVTIPDVSDMDLEGYSHPDIKLYWFEDYADDDANYASTGTKSLTGGVAQRYRNARDAFKTVYHLESSHLTPAKNLYLALTLGYDFKSLVIKRKGLDPGEQAIYLIEGPSSYVQRVVIYGTDSEWDQAMVINLPDGAYKVTETTWTWYNDDKTEGEGYNYKTHSSIAEDNKTSRIFEFENYHAKGGSVPAHDERAKENRLKIIML